MSKMLKDTPLLMPNAPDEVRDRIQTAIDRRGRPHKSFQELWELAGSGEEPADDADEFIAEARSIWRDENHG